MATSKKSKLNYWVPEEVNLLKTLIPKDKVREVGNDSKLLSDITKQINAKFGNNRTTKAVHIKSNLVHGFWGVPHKKTSVVNTPSISTPIKEEKMSNHKEATTTILFQKATGKYLYLDKENKIHELRLVVI